MSSLIDSHRMKITIAPMHIMTIFRSSPLVACLALLAFLSLSGCSFKTEPSSLEDFSYGNGRDVKRIDGNGDTVSWGDFSGNFVWAEYAAAWCSTCDRQASELRGMDQKEVVHITIMTIEMGGYGHPATQQTAANWARHYDLDPADVIAADMTSKTVPHHILFSPEGQILFEQSGFISRDNIGRVISAQQKNWKEWKTSGAGR